MSEETQAAETPAEEVAEPNPIFAKEPEEAPAEEGKAEEAEPTEEPKEEKKPNGLQLRLSEVARQRRNARREAERARQEAAEARKQLEAASPFEAAIRKHYGRFKDPLKALDGDVAYFDTLEALKDHPIVAPALRLVAEQMKKNGGAMTTEDATQETKASQATETAIPPQVAKLLRKAQADSIDMTLAEAGVRKPFVAAIRDSILARPNADAAEIERDDVIEAAREYVEKYGFAETDVLEAATSGGRQRVPTSKSSRPAVSSGAREEKRAPAAASAERPTNLSQWEASKEARKRALLADLDS